MRVSSPIGDLPFEPRRARLGRDGLHVEGAMGAWPAHVHVAPSDLPALARLVPRGALVAVAAAVALRLAVRARRR